MFNLDNASFLNFHQGANGELKNITFTGSTNGANWVIRSSHWNTVGTLLTIDNCKFTDLQGQAVDIGERNRANISNCVFAGNTANISNGAKGSSLYLSHYTEVNLSNCLFYNNQDVDNSSNHWGTIYVSSAQYTLNIDGCTFYDNGGELSLIHI